MSNETETANAKRRRPDYIAHAVVPASAPTGTRFIRMGVGFNLKKGGVSVLCDGVALSGHVILTAIDDDLPPLEGFSHGHPPRAGDFIASLGRDSGRETYWTDLGQAWKYDTHISVHAAVFPAAGKFVLFPNAREG